jgi:hypothetical protein
VQTHLAQIALTPAASPALRYPYGELIAIRIMHINRMQMFRNCNNQKGEMSNQQNIAVYWDVTPSGSCKNRGFGGTYRLHYQDDKNRRAMKQLASVASYC